MILSGLLIQKKKMTEAEKKRALICLRFAIEIAGDGGPQPFTEKEYELMYRFLNELENETQEE